MPTSERGDPSTAQTWSAAGRSKSCSSQVRVGKTASHTILGRLEMILMICAQMGAAPHSSNLLGRFEGKGFVCPGVPSHRPARTNTWALQRTQLSYRLSATRRSQACGRSYSDRSSLTESRQRADRKHVGGPTTNAAVLPTLGNAQVNQHVQGAWALQRTQQSYRVSATRRSQALSD